MDPDAPDPYEALGVARDANQNAIKTAYRKLALRYHPDKAKDKADEFHKIQVAYEAIGEEDARNKYDAEYKLRQLKKESAARYKPTPTPHFAGFEFRPANPQFDMRGSPKPDFAYSSRPPHAFETTERRPPQASAPQSSPRPNGFRPGDEGDYFYPATHKSKFDFEETPRRSARAPQTTPRSNPRTRDDKLRTEAKKDKLDGTTKIRNAGRDKERTRVRGYDRRSKAASVASVDSDDSGTDFSDVERTRATSGRNGIRYEYVRPKARSSPRRDSDDEYSRNGKTSQKVWEAKAEAKISSVKDYIQKSRIDGAPIERGGPPPAYSYSDTEDRLKSVRREVEEEYRPGSSRKRSPKTDRRVPIDPARRSTSSKTNLASEESSRRRPQPYNAPYSTPAEGQMPAPTSAPRRPRATSDADRDPPRGRPSDIKRSETQPSPRSIPRDTPTMQPSNLRQNEKVDDDSGYNTSNSPSEDSPPQPAANANPEPTKPSSTKYRYSSEEHLESSRQPHHDSRKPSAATERMTRSPSPMSRPSSSKQERARGPPPSRSASYAEFARNNEVDRDRPPPRRSDSSNEPRRHTTPSRPGSREPESMRTVSGTGSSRKPEPNRQTSAPLPNRSNSGLGINTTRDQRTGGRLFNEITGSPTELENMVDQAKNLPNAPPLGSSRHDRGRRSFDDRAPSGSASEQRKRPSRQYLQPLNAEDAYGVPPPPRRLSDDLTAKAGADLENYAKKYISESRRPPVPGRSTTLA